jgi:thioredoxin reductase
MTLPARNTLAVIGAGPVGLEALCAGLDRGFDVHVFERGEVGSHPIAWGHVRMFTPWRMNLAPSSTARLRAAGWKAPDPETCPTGLELAESYLHPLAALPELKARIHSHSQVVHASRSGALKHDLVGDARRREHPFRLLVRDQGGRENFLHAFALIDASGVYAQPNWAGDGGIPARGELYLAPQLSYHPDDVLGLRRERYAGKRTLVIGGGASAATVVGDLARLAADAPGTAVVWATRAVPGAVLPEIANDPLPERRALYARARELASGASAAVTHVGGARVEGFEFNSATHRYRVTLMVGEMPRVEEIDQVIVNNGFGPDHSIHRELQVHECYATRAPMKLAAALRGAGASDCIDTPSFGADVLAHPEPDFYILGNKSYGRSSNFLLETGYRQVADVIDRLAAELKIFSAV